MGWLSSAAIWLTESPEGCTTCSLQRSGIPRANPDMWKDLHDWQPLASLLLYKRWAQPLAAFSIATLVKASKMA